jgi:hypothetical protein
VSLTQGFVGAVGVELSGSQFARMVIAAVTLLQDPSAGLKVPAQLPLVIVNLSPVFTRT